MRYTSHTDCQELVAVYSRSRGIISSHTLLFCRAIKRSGGVDNRKEIDQLNRNDLGALLEQIIVFVIKVKVHWCHAVSVVFFFLIFLLGFYRRGCPPFPSIEILTAALVD